VSPGIDARARASFVFEDVTGRRWPRVKRIVLVMAGLGAVATAGLAFALLSVAPGRSSPWSQAVGLAEQVRDWPQRGSNPGSNAASSGEGSSLSLSPPARRVASLPAQGRSSSAAGATSQAAGHPPPAIGSQGTEVAPRPSAAALTVPSPTPAPAPAPSPSATPGPSGLPLPTPIAPSPLPTVSPPPPIPTIAPPPIPTAVPLAVVGGARRGSG
jgi:hypothetical protein